VIRLSSIGDIVNALPAVAALGQSFPQTEIHWLIEHRYAPLLTGNPYVHRVLALDTLSSHGNKGDFCPERTRRLLDLIDAETTKPIAVFTHHPPFEVTVGPERLHFETPEIMSRLRQALQHSARVVAVFSGHVHRAAEGHVGSIPAIVVPCIATTLRKGEYPAHMKRRPIYYLHRFDPVWGFATEARMVGTRSSVAGARSDAA
jgi:hypothetical protein